MIIILFFSFQHSVFGAVKKRLAKKFVFQILSVLSVVHFG